MSSMTVQTFVLIGVVVGLSASVLASEGRFRSEIRMWSSSLYADLQQQEGKRTNSEQVASVPKAYGALTLTLNTFPENAKVRIMNIKPRYQPGMTLPAGAYDVQVSAPSYKTLRTWITLDAEHQIFQARLKKAQ